MIWKPIPCCAVLLVSAALVAGCGDDAPETPAAPPAAAAPSLGSLTAPTDAAAPTAPALEAPVPPAATGAALATPVNQPGEKDEEDGMDAGLKALNEALDEYRNNNESSPSSLEELVAKRYIRALPAPPPGKKYALDKESGLAVIQ